MRFLSAAVLLTCTVMFHPSLFAQAESQQRGQAQPPMKIGNVTIIKANVTSRTGVVLDDTGTVHLLSILSNGEQNLLRISRKGAVQDLIMYRGWPYILDRRGRLYAFDVSWKTNFKNKIPYMAMRSVRTIPFAIGAGIGVYGLALLDQTFTGIITSATFHSSEAFWSGFMGYYGLDIAHTLFIKSHRKINRGANFFTTLVATGVTDIQPDKDYDDYRVVMRRGRSQADQRFLSHMAPAYAGHSSCIEYLTKMNLR